MTPRLTLRGVTRSFGPTRALDGVDVDFLPGEVHAVIGENGAGKSTLMKVMSGAVRPDAGVMHLDGARFAPRGPDEARRRGVAMIYQELTLAPHLSVLANVTLGMESTRWGFLRSGDARRRVRAALAELDHPEIHPDDPVAALGPAACQVVEIARALLLDARVLVLDEPTSSLTRPDVERLFALVRRLRARGVTVVYISHFLEEVQQIADRFTVLRDGRAVAGGAMAEFAVERVIEWMVGRPLTEQFPRIPRQITAPLLEVAGLAGDRAPRAASFTLRRGEVLGIAGVIGAGRTELLRAVYGLDPVRLGQVRVLTVTGKARCVATPAGRIAEGVGLLSEDRKDEGLALGQSIADNLTYTRLAPYARFGLLNLPRRARAVAEWAGRLRVRCAGPEQAVGELSGGNQQKVALGRLLHQQADVLLLDEPTRGVDVGSKAEIYRLIGELASAGKGVVFVSSYLPELLGVCDTLAVMSRGRLSAVRPAADWTPESVMAATVRTEEGGTRAHE